VTESYTVFWTMDRWLGALAVGHKPLPVLFGGPHLSEPSFRRAGVKVGDLLYPVAVMNHQVFVIGRMRVREMLLIAQEDGPTLIDQRFPQFKAWKLLAPTCTEEVVVGAEGDHPAGRSGRSRPTCSAGSPSAPSAGERPLKYVKGRRTHALGRPARHLPALGRARPRTWPS
jgi:hypothetical protein